MRFLVALGSNVGNRAAALDAAVAALAREGVACLRGSSVVETEAWGDPVGAPYLNRVIEVATRLDPWELLAVCKAIEGEIGRDPVTARNAPRCIDIDLVACRGTTITSSRLTLPHPRLAGRVFWHAPLEDLGAGGVVSCV